MKDERGLDEIDYQILRYLEQREAKGELPSTVREVATHINRWTSSTHRRLMILLDMGEITFPPHVARGIRRSPGKHL